LVLFSIVLRDFHARPLQVLHERALRIPAEGGDAKLNFYLGLVGGAFAPADGRGFIVHKAAVSYVEIVNSEACIEAKNAEKSGFKHSEASKELIRKANLGRSHSLETIQKLSSNSPNSKAVIVTNNETLETIEFPSISSSAKYMSVDGSYLRSCIKNNKSCPPPSLRGVYCS
jgi:hypothetical protein